jgi:y4mF family transcriptional regulator
MKVRTAGDLGAVVRSARETAGLTQRELAARTGVSREWLVAFESGKGTAQLRLVLDVLSVLGMTVEVEAAGQKHA